MPHNIFDTDPWRTISAAVKKSPAKCQVAVAFFGNGASRMLPLTKGSTLVVDFSPANIKAGQTNPSEILKLLKRGVEVHSVRNLHAKVFVAGPKAIIGSMNVSHHSKDDLIEAAIETTDPKIVRSCIKFVNHLCGEFITPAYAKKMVPLYNPPRFGGKKKTGGKKDKGPTEHSRLWLAPLVKGDWNEKDLEVEKKGKPSARKKMRSSRSYELDDFWIYEGKCSRDVTFGDLIVQVVDEGDKTFITPVARCLSKRKYRDPEDPKTKVMIYIELPRKARRISIENASNRLGRITFSAFKDLKTSPQLVKNQAIVHKILNLWAVTAKPDV